MTSDPGVSVVICTYSLDRWDDLARSVDSVRAQTMPPHEIVLVVDHNPALLERASAEWPEVRVVASDGQPGLAGARNSGLGHVSGDILAYLDDDAAARPDWIAELVRAYRSPDVLGVGGASIPRWDQPRPGWFPPEFDWVIGCSYRGLPEVAAPVRNFIGSNMSFRTEQLRQVDGFNVGLGRVGTRPTGCEETELCIRLAQRFDGQHLVYEPRAQVDHRVPAQRATLRYFGARCLAEGQSKAIVSRLVGSKRGLATERRYATRVLPLAVAHALGASIRNRRLSDAGEAAAIAAGLLITSVGYLLGILSAPRRTVS